MIDKIKKILQDFQILITDEWNQKSKLTGLNIYYIVFELCNNTYCISYDSLSFVFSKDEMTHLKFIYIGSNLKDLKESIKRVVQNEKQNIQ